MHIGNVGKGSACEAPPRDNTQTGGSDPANQGGPLVEGGADADAGPW